MKGLRTPGFAPNPVVDEETGRRRYADGSGPFFGNRASRRSLLFTRPGREQARYARMVAEKGES